MNAAAYALAVALVTGAVSASAAVAAARWRGRSGSGSEGSHPGRVAMIDAVWATVAGGGIFVASALFGALATDLNLFGVIHIAYLELVIGAPLAAALVLVGGMRAHRRWTPPWRALTRPAGVVAVLCLGFAPLGFYMTHVEPYRLETETVSGIALVAGRGGSQSIRIGVVADLQTDHVGGYEMQAVDRLLAERPDIIMLAGDIFQDDEVAFRRELPALKALFNRMSAPGGAFLVVGDTDPAEHLRELAAGTPVRFLENEIVQTKVADRDVTIGGTALDYAAPVATVVSRTLESTPGQQDIRILLSHRPDAVYNLPTGQPRTDLVVSGHTHGGQVAIPFFGPVMTLTSVPRRVAAGGLHDLDGRRVYVGRGVGLERAQAPQMRLFVRPNIGILTGG